MTALAKVAAACSLGVWPAPLDVLSMLEQSGADAVSSRDLVARYAIALAEQRPSGEASILRALRSVSFGDHG